MLALYTDGITEGSDNNEKEFGEECLIERLRQHRDQPCQLALEGITEEVRSLNPADQHDDITLILAKCKTR